MTTAFKLISRQVNTPQAGLYGGTLVDCSRFEGHLRQAIAQAERTGEQIALHLLDLDRFGGVNGSHDEVVSTVTGRLASIIRQTDSFVQLAEHRFAVLQRAIGGSEGVTTLARKLLGAVSEPIRVGGLELRLCPAVGICLHAPGIDSAGLVTRAGDAVRAARAEGARSFRYHNEAMTETLRARVLLDEKLEQALRKGEFFLEYQPQVDLKTGRTMAFEALLRWRDPQRGVIGPQEFIAVAERTGLIVDLGIWALEEACRYCRNWSRTTLPGVPVAVNLSAVQLKDSGFLDRALRVLERTGLSGDLLELELTETIDLEQSVAVREALGELRRRGTRFSIDDFGTGYGSLCYLRALPVDKIKIPQEFVRPASASSADRAIVDAVAQLGRRLGLTVVAEGVETPAQLAALSSAGCDAAQGFLFGRPAATARPGRWDWSTEPRRSESRTIHRLVRGPQVAGFATGSG